MIRLALATLATIQSVRSTRCTAANVQSHTTSIINITPCATTPSRALERLNLDPECPYSNLIFPPAHPLATDPEL